MSASKRVSYYYHPSTPHFYYGPAHPMKPHRLKLAHHLILGYELHKLMDTYTPHPADFGEMTQYFHSEEYIQFLKKITPDNIRQYLSQTHKYNVGPTEDCPVFDGLYEFNQYTTGASIDGAVQLCTDQVDIAINWSGGFHHAKKSEASGFCYVNDIVLAICEMLKVYSRVLYIDIDVHHGDGVEEAFYCTDRVMTFSLHKFGDFFPGTGALQDKGAKEGEGFSLNAPLENGVTDDQYFEDLFKPVFDKIMEVYQPGAIFLQCGADSLAADRLGTLNLTTRGHAKCVDYVKTKNVPTLVAGGGGYTIRNVARVWCYETAVLVDRPDIPNAIPFNNYYEYFAPSYELHLTPENMENLNTKSKIEAIRIDLLQQLQQLQGAPSVAMQQVPPLYERREEKDVADEKEADDDDNNGSGGPNNNNNNSNNNQHQHHRKKAKRKTKKHHGSELYDNVD